MRVQFLIIFTIFIIFIGCKDFLSSINDERTYVVQTINDVSIKEFAAKFHTYDWPLAIKLKIVETGKTDTTYEGRVKLAKLGWQKIENYDEYADDNQFYIDTKNKLGPVESIGFKKLKITNSDMNGIWACSGPTIDAPSYTFTAIIDK